MRMYYFNLTLLFTLIVNLGFSSDLIEMGKGSYGTPIIGHWGANAKVRVGKYCSIAGDATILIGGNHRPDWVTTYPFSVLWEQGKFFSGHPSTKGDVIIGNDVWIGLGSVILSGVKIGDGAVVGAKAVVAKDVPPYAIVVGNPAKVVKYRFRPDQIEKLLAIAWWDWSDEQIANALPYLLNDNIDLFLHVYGKK